VTFLLIAYLCLHAGFTWARIAVFRIDGATPKGVRIIEFFASASICVGCAVLWNHGDPSPVRLILGACIASASAVLFLWGLSTIRRHQLSAAFSVDLPNSLVTRGPYRYIRNPFYLAYILGHAVPLASTASAWAVPGLAVMVAVYVRATLLEERKFLASELAPEWTRYRKRTGRYLPRFAPCRDG